MILNILKAFDLGPSTSLADRVHIHAEAVKLVYHHRDALICDPASMTVSVADLLSDEATQRLARRIDMSRARPPVFWHEPEHSDTVYLCVVDRDGNMVSFINSIFDAFGSTRLDPATGVLFHSRGSSFRLLEGHPNALAPRKRPMHTIIPASYGATARAAGVFGVMGGHYQAAGQAAFLSGLFDRGLDPQAALDAPRSFAFDGVLELEPAYPDAVLADLSARGHVVRRAVEPLGGGQAIFVDEDRGILVAGSDGRKRRLGARLLTPAVSMCFLWTPLRRHPDATKGWPVVTLPQPRTIGCIDRAARLRAAVKPEASEGLMDVEGRSA